MSHQGQLSDLPLSQVLDRLAEKTPEPGAGSTVALVCGLAAALLEMAAAFDSSPMGLACGVRAAALRARALELAERERHSYAPVLEVLRLPASHPERATRLASALAGASTAPLAIASVGAQLAGIAAETVDGVSDQLVGEAVVASELAEGACRAAARLVEINLAGAPGDPRLTEVAGLVKSAAESRAETLAKAAA
jgi:methenyltetrahydrofolate cyclohydrolase